jgi:hypothetical protein
MVHVGWEAESADDDTHRPGDEHAFDQPGCVRRSCEELTLIVSCGTMRPARAAASRTSPTAIA